MIPQLPLTVEPLRDEALPSILARASDLTGYPVRHLYPGDLRTLLDNPSAGELRILGSVLGITPAQLRRHTLKHRLRGQYDTLTPRDQRGAVGLRCPECGSSPLWSRLTLVTSCLECGLLLTRDDTRTAAPREALAMQRAYIRGLCRPTRADAERIDRLWWLLEFCRCTGWPGGQHHPGSQHHADRGARGPDWKSPQWIAKLAGTAWPASAIPSTALIGHTVLEFLGVPDDHGIDVEAERRRLHDLLRRARLTDQNIPDYVLDSVPILEAGCHIEAIGHAMSRALVIESIHAYSGVRPDLRAFHSTYRPTEDDTEVEIYVHDLRHSIGGLRRLQHEAYDVSRHRCNYEHRRAVLRTLRSVPPQVLGQLSIKTSDRTARTAAAWIWVELTHGTLRHSPHNAGIRTTLRRFDAELTPEDRWILIEHGEDFLGAVADDVARQHRPTGSVAEVRANVG